MSKKEPFLKIVPVKALKAQSVKRLLIAYIVLFWILPFVKFIPTGGGTKPENWYLLVIVPISLLGTGGILTMKYGFYPLYPIAVLVGSIPTALIFSFSPFWQYALSYGVIAVAGNLVSELLRTSSKEYYKNRKDTE